MYMMIIEKYYDKKVSQMFLVVLHLDQYNYIKIIISRMTDLIMKILAIRKNIIKIDYSIVPYRI